jgi:hypothetical protein
LEKVINKTKVLKKDWANFLPFNSEMEKYNLDFRT